MLPNEFAEIPEMVDEPIHGPTPPQLKPHVRHVILHVQAAVLLRRHPVRRRPEGKVGVYRGSSADTNTRGGAGFAPRSEGAAGTFPR
jgi:hypothetical protein